MLEWPRVSVGEDCGTGTTTPKGVSAAPRVSRVGRNVRPCVGRVVRGRARTLEVPSSEAGTDVKGATVSFWGHVLRRLFTRVLSTFSLPPGRLTTRHVESPVPTERDRHD